MGVISSKGNVLWKLVVSFLEYLLIMPHNLSLSEKKHVQILVNLLEGVAEQQRGSSAVHSLWLGGRCWWKDKPMPSGIGMMSF